MAKPKLALIPATQGSKLYSVLPADGVGDFTFSRNSAATRINKDGLIETVASGVSRLNYPLIDGVVNGCPSHLLEPTRSNLTTYSESFSNAYWVKSGSNVTSGFTSPSGDTSAFKLVESATTSRHFMYNTVSGLTSGADYNISFYVKAAEKSNIWIYDDGGANNGVAFDLTNGSIIYSNTSENYLITKLIDGWYRISIVSPLASTDRYPLIELLEDSYTTGKPIAYTGDGTSGVYIFGAQLEQGSYPTSYIPTSGSAVTRVAETANGAGDASTFNSSEGVLMAEISALAAAPTRVITLGDGTSSNRIQFYYNSSNVLNGNVINVGSSQVTGFSYNGDSNTPNKVALKYKVNDFSFWVNGFKIAVDTNGLTPVGLNELEFNNGAGGADFYGNTKQIQYFDSALNDSDLETLTSWTSFTDLANGQLYSIK